MNPISSEGGDSDRWRPAGCLAISPGVGRVASALSVVDQYAYAVLMKIDSTIIDREKKLKSAWTTIVVHTLCRS